jgi:hypothetical protein
MKNISLGLLVLLTLFLILSCRQPENKTSKEQLLTQYVGVWNGDSPDLLDSIADKNFQLRMVPAFDATRGIEYLKYEISQTRTYFPDFFLEETERLFIGDTAVVIRWTATGNFKNKNKMSSGSGKINVPGFSVIFFNNGKITGEWIAYSDLTWYKQLGFNLVPPTASKK